MERLIERVVLPRHPRLGRNVNHDSESRRFRVAPRHLGQIRPVRHEAHVPILDQGSLGSCTGNAGVAALYRHPYVAGVVKPFGTFTPNEPGAVNLYTEATKIDPFAGEMPAEDTGSDGLSIAKVLKRTGAVSGYLWAFTLLEALAQLAETPVITGVPWLNSMFDTTNSGHAGHLVVRQESGMAGGHEICADEVLTPAGAVLDASGSVDLSQVWVGGPNSWGTSWGDQGRWYMTAAEWGWLLSQQGDVTAFVPATKPQPTPTPAPSGDAAGDALWSATKAWAAAPHTGSNARAAKAVTAWAKSTGRG